MKDDLRVDDDGDVYEKCGSTPKECERVRNCIREIKETKPKQGGVKEEQIADLEAWIEKHDKEHDKEETPLDENE